MLTHYHTHWARPGSVYFSSVNGDRPTDIDIILGNAEQTTANRYHSFDDIQFDNLVNLNSYVINRYDYSFHNGTNVFYSGRWNDPFIRFFLFPYFMPKQ